MKNLQTYRLFALMIAMKRDRVNSVIFKPNVNKLAKRYNMSFRTFKKYMELAKKMGLVKEEKDRYTVIRFKTIVVKISKELNLFFGHYQVIVNDKSDSALDTKEITEWLLTYGIKDGIINQQKFAIERNLRDIELIKSALPKTDKRHTSAVMFDKANYRRLKKLSRTGKLSAQELDRLTRSTKKEIITSRRHAAKVLGVSTNRAAKTFKKKDTGFVVVTNTLWINGCNHFLNEKARIDFPRAKVIPLPYHNRIKVCFGSLIQETA